MEQANLQTLFIMSRTHTLDSLSHESTSLAKSTWAPTHHVRGMHPSRLSATDRGSLGRGAVDVVPCLEAAIK